MATDVRQTHFRFGKDDGTESSHTWWQLEDVDHSQEISADWTFLLRFTEQEMGGTAAANTDAVFQYNKNGAGWVDITTTSSVVKAVAVNAFTNGQACTKRLSGTGTFETSGAGCTEDGSSGGPANDIAASGNSETEAGLQVVFADVANGDTIQFRFTSPDWAVTYTITPTLTITLSLTAIGDTTQEIWNVRQAVPDTSQSIWNVRAALGDTSQYAYNVRAAVADTSQAIWNVGAAIGDTIQHIWDVRFALGKPVQIVHNVLTSIGDTMQTIWNVLTSATVVGDTFALAWNVRVALGKASQSVWNVRSLATKTSQIVWNTLTAVYDTIQSVWNARAILGKQSQSVWNVYTVLGKVSDYLWSVNTAVSKAGAFVWNSLASISDNLEITWPVYQAVGRTRQLAWKVKSLFTPILYLLAQIRKALVVSPEIKGLTLKGAFTRDLTMECYIQKHLSLTTTIKGGG